MYISSVRASAFGPLRSETLDLAPGLNVVHGPNEAGKSSWFAATYAGLAGRRRMRGRGTTAQAEFAKRHKPWAGSRWSAGVTVTLDSGLTLALEHDLVKGEARIVDASTRRPVTLTELERRLGIELTTEATLDGTRLLGLNRDSARATIFTGQADILRVSNDASELQELLERAATTEAVDATADGALTWLANHRSDWVGSASVGNRPLRARRMDLDKARAVTAARRDDLIRLTEAIAERQRIDVPLRRAREDLELADRLLRWQDVYELRARVEQAVDHSTELARLAEADLTVDEDKVRSAAAVLGAFEAGSDVAPLPPGLSAADLQAEIDALPDHPEGDLEPRPEVQAAHRELSRAQTALTTHVRNAPADTPKNVATQLSPDELRALADALEAPLPVIDPALPLQLATLRQEAQDAATAYANAQAEYDAATARNDETLRAHAAVVDEHDRVLAEFERAKAELTAEFEALRQAAEEAAVAYASAKAAYDSVIRQNEEKQRTYDEAVELHARTSADFERVQAERAAEYAVLQTQAADAAAAHVRAQGAYDAAIHRNEERRRSHAVAVEEHRLAFAEFERVKAEQTAEYEALRREAEEAAVAHASAKAAFDAVVRQNDEKQRAHQEAAQAHAQALAAFERTRNERTAEFESLDRKAQDAAAAYAQAQAAYEAATRRNEEKGWAHTAAVDAHTRAAANFERVQADRAARRQAERRQAEQLAAAARRRSTILLSVGAALLVVGIVLSIAGVVLPGSLLAIVGGAVLVAGFLTGRTSAAAAQPADDTDTGPAAPVPPAPPRLEEITVPVAPTADPRLVELQIELKAQAPVAPAPPTVEQVEPPAVPVPNPRLAELQGLLKAQPPAPPVLDEVEPPVAPVVNPRLTELQVELKAQAPVAPVPPVFEEVEPPAAPTPDPRLAELQDLLKKQAPALAPAPVLEDVQPPVVPRPDPHLTEVQAELMAQETALRQHQERVADARSRVMAEQLDPDPVTLRQLARAIDDADAARERARVHAEKAANSRATRDDALRVLAEFLGREIPSEVTDDVVDEVMQAFEAYVAACRERVAVAQRAARRPDLVAAHEQRQQVESAHAAAVAERKRQGVAVCGFADALGVDASSVTQAVGQLRLWERDQEAKREALAERRSLAARLDQVLAGRDLAEWQAELASLVESAGPEPDTRPTDLDQFRAEAARRYEVVIGRAGQLEGQQQQLSQVLGSVAEAIEHEADAERAAVQVATLAACIDAATAQLNLAKERAHASIAPALEARMRPWLPRVTSGRYLDVAVEPSTLTMQVTDANGAIRQAALLSQGTTEQLFLLLRVTLSQVLSGGTEIAPLILDDVTTQSDRDRKLAIMELLHEISVEHQVVMFTQEREVIAWAETHLKAERDKLIALPAPGQREDLSVRVPITSRQQPQRRERV
ncbi:AAA family ATPase [Micromonospora sp. NPDC004540]|uniref:AAA family ATPase n=1 Tax=Micromonospora sp. NPDC004540 TaxID=3154457 RepID=UPI0033A94454